MMIINRIMPIIVNYISNDQQSEIQPA